MPLTLRSPAASLAAPDSPLAGLVGASRRAAFRRRLIRRIASVALLLSATALILLRPGATAGPSSAPAASDPATRHAAIPAVLADAEPSPAAEPTTKPATAALGPADSAGAEAVPPGRVGVVVPIDPALAPRLRAGDLVDIYRSGSTKRVATEAIVVDVTRPAALQQSDFGPGVPGEAPALAATAFVAVSAREAAGIPAGQRGSERTATSWWVTVRPRSVAATP